MAYRFIRFFEELGIDDVPLVGGKNASLGEMYRALTPKGVRVPNGFAVTAEAYKYVLTRAGAWDELHAVLDDLDPDDVEDLKRRGHQARRIVYEAGVPDDLRAEILDAYRRLERQYGEELSVAVRSSATAEDLPTASFAGQQETYLNIRGDEALIEAVRRCFASLFTDRAIHYRIDQGFDHFKVFLSVGVQKMVRSDLAASGVMFSIDTETGFPEVVFINAAYGLGETVVQGAVDPDEFYVFKPTFRQGYRAVLRRKLGSKKIKMVYAVGGDRQTTRVVPTPKADQRRFCIGDDDVLVLADYAIKVEDHYGRPMDMEWAKDGIDGQLYLVQARPETVASRKNVAVLEEYRLTGSGRVLVEGRAVGTKISAGTVRVVPDVAHLSSFRPGEVLVADMTTPDWEPVMKTAAAIVTNRGGRTCFTGDTQVLTNEGFMTLAAIYRRGVRGLQTLSLDRRTLKLVWRPIEAVMRRTGAVIGVSLSQTGQVKDNLLRLTTDHKMLNLRRAALVDTDVQTMLSEGECALVAQRCPGLGDASSAEADVSLLGYFLGGLLSDGHIRLTRRRGEISFLQKEVPEKAAFIAFMEECLFELYGRRFSKRLKTVSSGSIRGGAVVGQASHFRCYSKAIAAGLVEVRESLERQLLQQDERFAAAFLAGLGDGDGSLGADRRLHLYVSKASVLRAVTIACLRLGIVPQVTTNRTIWNVQISEKLDSILKYSKRLDGRRCRERSARFFNTRQLFDGRWSTDINTRLDRNLLIGEVALRHQLEGVARRDTVLAQRLRRLLEGDVRQLRMVAVEDAAPAEVYNLTVAEHHNYVVFTERLTPVLVNNCHAAIVARELGIPAVVGTGNATEVLEDGRSVTVSCAEGEVGRVYEGEIPFEVEKIDLSRLPKPRTEIMINLGNPEIAFQTAFLPADGVGLARMEFIINEYIKVHPMALVHPEKVADEDERRAIEKLTRGYDDPKAFFVRTLAEGVGTIAAAFYPKPVVVRMSDFKTNEYASLLGGRWFEPVEANPMLGFRGAARYAHPAYAEGFALECAAMKRVREVMGLTNVILMLPFVRRVDEAERVLAKMAELGLTRGENGLRVYCMCEIPNNVILIDRFAEHFDGFSIGSNDLTQLTLGVDRDSERVAFDYDERDEGVKAMMRLAIEGCRRNGVHSGICGQAPSDYAEIAEFLVECGIDSMSVNPDTLLRTLRLVVAVEERLGRLPAD